MLHIALARVSRSARLLLPLLVWAASARAQDATVVVADSLPAMTRSVPVAPSNESAVARFAPFGDVASDLRRLYGDGDVELLWTRGGVLTAPARATLDALLRLDDRGLDPARVDLTLVRALAGGGLLTEPERFAFDAALSAASIRTLRLLHGGAAGNDGAVRDSGDAAAASAGNTGIGGRPRAVAAAANPSATAATTRDFTTDLRTLAATARPDSLLDAAEPASPQYRLLRQSLPTYRTRATSDPTARHQLSQILATLERARVMRDPGPVDGVVVNIPAFQLQATGGEQGADTLRMDVVVGTASTHRTPEMRDSIQYLVFAPYWEVPASIIRSELLPIARRDPHLLTLNNFQIVDRRGKVLPATARSVTELAAGRARIRQLPGGTNSLGRVKFMFPNADDVYLHDTPLRNDFALQRRDRSHGCVRVADPAALARFLLRDQPEWTAARIEAAMNGTAPVTVRLTRPVPIVLTYATAVARADGGVDFFDDIYGLDPAPR